LITILGPTATGKTALAARLAFELNGEVISADSRQVYRGMNIGTGKDYDDYILQATQVPYHLIDIVDPGYEYNIFEYQKDFLKAYNSIISRNKLPILCGGSGMYLEAVLKSYMLEKSADDEKFQASLEEKTHDELIGILRSYKTPHNITDLEEHPRLMKAIMVARAAAMAGNDDEPHGKDNRRDGHFPMIDSTNFGIDYPRGLIKSRIVSRLEFRLEHGMIDEVQQLLDRGISAERLMKYGLEYKFVTLYLTGKLSRSDLFSSLNIAIRQFAKRQMTWFRRMERQGIKIHWIDGRLPLEAKVAAIISIIKT
jgi:tRNA dimethylallyltransferase